MATLPLGRRTAQRGVVSVPVGRKFDVTAPVDVSISISANAAGDALLGSVAFAMLKGGTTYTFLIPASSPPQFLSGLTTDPNGDTTPTQLDFADKGPSNI